MATRSLALALLPLALPSTALAQCVPWDTRFHSYLEGGLGVDGPIGALQVHDDGSGSALYAAGLFYNAGDAPALDVARWNGTQWSALGAPGSGMNNGVSALLVYDSGAGPRLVAAGSFTLAGGVAANRIASWDGASWSALGSGLDGSVFALEVFDDGSGPALYAGGVFTTAGGVPASAIARWDGASWSALGGGIDNFVSALEVFDDGDGPALYAGGIFATAGGVAAKNIAKWDGASWSSIGDMTGIGARVEALLVHDDGSGPALFAGGGFTDAGGQPANLIARWDGASWSPLGTGLTSPIAGERVYALATYDAGGGSQLVAGGNFTTAGGVDVRNLATWDGAGWSGLVAAGGELGMIHDSVLALAVFDGDADGDADLCAGGNFVAAANTIPSERLAIWHGCPPASEAFCFGDGTGASCPCANEGLPGHGCRNSTSVRGAELESSGTTVPDTLVLEVAFEPPTALSIFLQGSAELAGPAVFGDGLRCVGGTLKRLYVENAVGGLVSAPAPGDPSITEQSALLGDPIAAGSTRYYQTYYRDADPGFCPAPQGDNFNVSNGLRVVW